MLPLPPLPPEQRLLWDGASQKMAVTVSYRTIIAGVLFLTLLQGAAASAKQENRPWQTGRLAELKVTACGFFPKCLEVGIRTRDTLYVSQWSTGRTGVLRKYPSFRIVGPVEFAIENNALYIRSAKGREYKTRLIEKVPIPDRSSIIPEETT
jgi:hypothetical protein